MRGQRFEEVLRNCREGDPLELSPEELAEGWHYCPEIHMQLAQIKTVGGKPWCGCTPMSNPPRLAWELFLKEISVGNPSTVVFAISDCLSELDRLRDLVKRCRPYIEIEVLTTAEQTGAERQPVGLLRDIDALGLI